MTLTTKETSSSVPGTLVKLIRLSVKVGFFPSASTVELE
jgi:hypothetical protein